MHLSKKSANVVLKYRSHSLGFDGNRNKSIRANEPLLLWLVQSVSCEHSKGQNARNNHFAIDYCSRLKNLPATARISDWCTHPLIYDCRCLITNYSWKVLFFLFASHFWSEKHENIIDGLLARAPPPPYTSTVDQFLARPTYTAMMATYKQCTPKIAHSNTIELKSNHSNTWKEVGERMRMRKFQIVFQLWPLEHMCMHCLKEKETCKRNVQFWCGWFYRSVYLWEIPSAVLWW